MTKEEAVTLIEKISESLRDNPSQFKPNVFVTGVQGPRGGCREYSVYIEGDIELNVNAAQEAANRVITDQMQAAIDSLNALVTQLRSPTPDRSIISTYLQSLRDNLLPEVITSTITSIITLALGGIFT